MSGPSLSGEEESKRMIESGWSDECVITVLERLKSTYQYIYDT
jgi:hypothetical protein